MKLEVKKIETQNGIRGLRPEEYRPLSEFLEEQTSGFFTPDFWLDRFVYWWESNPSMMEDIPKGWILYNKEGNIAGFLGNIPVKYKYKNKEVITCSATSWYVSPQNRNRSIDLLLPFLKQKRLLFDSTPIDRVVQILVKYNFKKVPRDWLKYDAIFPVNIFEFCDHMLDKLFKRTGKNCSFAAPLIILLVSVLKVYQIIYKFFCGVFFKNDYSFREITSFDGRYTALYEEIKDNYEMLAARTHDCLNWLFFGSSQLRRTRRVMEIIKGGELCGYAAVKLIMRKIHGKKQYYYEVIDIFLNQSNKKLFYTLLNGLEYFANSAEEKIAFIKISPFYPNIKSALIRYGYFFKKGKGRILFREADHKKTEETLKQNTEQFFATPLDGDRCFFP